MDLLPRVIVPSRLGLIYRAGDTLAYNPGLNHWELLEADAAEVLRWLRAGRARAGLTSHLERRFAYTPAVAGERLSAILRWCILRRLLYLDRAPMLPVLSHPANPLETVYWICTQACNLRCTYCYQAAARARPRGRCSGGVGVIGRIPSWRRESCVCARRGGRADRVGGRSAGA
jgi:hypothetical protein